LSLETGQVRDVSVGWKAECSPGSRAGLILFFFCPETVI
jgi:hypothetical protein